MTSGLEARVDLIASELLAVAGAAADRRLVALSFTAASCMLMAKSLSQGNLNPKITEQLMRDFKVSLSGLVQRITVEFFTLEDFKHFSATRH